MDKKEFKKGTIVRIVRGPEKYRNKVMVIKGTTKKIWGIEDVNGSSDAFRYNPLYRYLLTEHPDLGTVYYAQYANNLLKDCVHESWIEKDENFDEDDIVVGASGGPTDDGGYYTEYHTMRDMKREQASKQQVESSMTLENSESQEPRNGAMSCIIL